jgi:hypothetical protein
MIGKRLVAAVRREWSSWVRWLIRILVVEEILGALSFTSYTSFLLPNPTGFAIQYAVWLMALPFVVITNALSPVLQLVIGDPALAFHAAFFAAVGIFSAAILAMHRLSRMVEQQRIAPQTAFSLGMLVTVVGAFADAYWHLTGLAAREGFFTPAHATIYSGVTVMLVSTLFLRVTGRVKQVLLVAGAFITAGGIWDFWWHSTYGFIDVVAWTPPHLTVTAGFLALLITGLMKLNTGWFTRLAFRATLGLFVILWSFVIVLALI